MHARPLTYVCYDPEDLSPLTPSNFMAVTIPLSFENKFFSMPKQRILFYLRRNYALERLIIMLNRLKLNTCNNYDQRIIAKVCSYLQFVLAMWSLSMIILLRKHYKCLVALLIFS